MRKRTFTMSAALVCCVALFLSSCANKTEEKKISPVRITTETLVTSNPLSGKNYVGEIEAEHSTAVSFAVGGTVRQLNVEEGQVISKGQTIGVIDATQMNNALSAAKAILTQAQDAYDRMKVLHERGSLSDMDWVGVESKLASAKSSYAMAKKNVGDCTLTAPCSGVIGKKLLETGMTAMPGQPVCTILDVSQVKVKISVPEKEVGNLTSASCTEAIISVEALGSEVFHPKGMQKGVQGNPVTHTYDLNLYVSNPAASLLPGMVANVTLPELGDVEPSRVTVPVNAVQRRSQGELFVWTMQDGKAACRTVTVGQSAGGRTEILSGLKEGDKVITKGYQKVSEGMQVTDK